MNAKRLYKNDKDRMICGVCSGIAEYFNVDPSLVRIGWLLFMFAAGTGLLAYIVAAIILPNKSEIQ
jgi:phage shock protein C